MLLGVAPFGLITGVAMVASGIAAPMAVLMSITVFAGASMIASAQLLGSGTPVLLVLFATLFINLRFMMYSASMRPHFAHAPLRWRLAVGYLVADNVCGLSLGRFADHPDDPAKLTALLASESGPEIAEVDLESFEVKRRIKTGPVPDGINLAAEDVKLDFGGGTGRAELKKRLFEAWNRPLHEAARRLPDVQFHVTGTPSAGDSRLPSPLP